MNEAGIMDLTLLVALAARDRTSDLAFVTRLTAWLRADVARRLTFATARRALPRALRAAERALLAARRAPLRAFERSRRAADFARDFPRLASRRRLPRPLRFLAILLSLWLKAE
jgi:hypothetical protein